MAYFDAAYLVKCYVKEEGWQEVRSLAAARGRIASSVIGRLELHAALHRKLREGGLTAEDHKIVLRQLSFDEATGVWHWIFAFARGRDGGGRSVQTASFRRVSAYWRCGSSRLREGAGIRGDLQ